MGIWSVVFGRQAAVRAVPTSLGCLGKSDQALLRQKGVDLFALFYPGQLASGTDEEMRAGGNEE